MKRTLTISFMAMLICAGMMSSCKEETIGATDPNIVYFSSGKTLVCVPSFTAADSFDINNDGLAEMFITMTNLGGDTGVIVLNSFTQTSGIAISGIAPVPGSRLFNVGETVPLSSSAFLSTAYVSYKVGGFRIGLINGEGYIGFRFTTGTKYNYGWAKVSINSSFTEFRILEYAYYVLPEHSINAGVR